jgi:F0F1-type ATP synthase assembly protein I
MDDPKESEDLKNTARILKEVGPYLGIGMQLAITVVGMVFLGRWIDSLTGKNPLFILIFSFFGIGAGLFNFIKTVINLSKKTDK